MWTEIIAMGVTAVIAEIIWRKVINPWLDRRPKHGWFLLCDIE